MELVYFVAPMQFIRDIYCIRIRNLVLMNEGSANTKNSQPIGKDIRSY